MDMFTIPGDGLFAGCRVYANENLPPDTIEMREGNTFLRANVKTGELLAGSYESLADIAANLNYGAIEERVIAAMIELKG